MTDKVVVVPYDPAWPVRFAEVRERLAAALTGVEILGIEHVGSTSVPGLAAKPVLDIDIIDIVVERTRVGAATAALAAAGYEPRGEMGIADRFAFRAPPGEVLQNTYVVVDGSLALRDHRALRDTLRAHDDLRDAYAAVKLQMAQKTGDINEYVEGKTPIILEILRRAGIAEEELDKLRRINTR
ncbi:grpb/dephospho-CoA kinase [Hyaloraphidium curvatum]|nr:grpb/dephospho-CoA kinase [Hyaloraphidium curvatum]